MASEEQHSSLTSGFHIHVPIRTQIKQASGSCSHKRAWHLVGIQRSSSDCTHLSQHWAKSSSEEALGGPSGGGDTLSSESGRSIFGRKKILCCLLPKSTPSLLPHTGPDCQEPSVKMKTKRKNKNQNKQKPSLVKDVECK